MLLLTRRIQTLIWALAKPLMKLIGYREDHQHHSINSSHKYILIGDNNSNMIKLQPIHLSANFLVTLILVVILFIIDKILPPVHRGFFCNDFSIMKPYVQNQTVPTNLLGSVAVILIVLTILLIEVIKKSLKKGSNASKEPVYVIGHQRIKPWVYVVVSRLFFTVVGGIMCLLFTDIGKKMVGRLRPHFLSVCKPNYNLFNCTDGYITADVCLQSDKNSLREARMSFPSGHSSTAAFTAVLIALYIQYSISIKNFSLFKSVAQFLVISLGVACGYTRIADYWHHWSDVLAGLLIGTAFAVYTIFVLMNLHTLKEIESVNAGSKRHAERDIESQARSEGYDNETSPYPSIVHDE